MTFAVTRALIKGVNIVMRFIVLSYSLQMAHRHFSHGTDFSNTFTNDTLKGYAWTFY